MSLYSQLCFASLNATSIALLKYTYALVLCNMTIAYTMVAHPSLPLHYATRNAPCIVAGSSPARLTLDPLRFSATIPSSTFLCLRSLCSHRPRKVCGTVAENHSTQMHRYNALRQRINRNSLREPSGAIEYAFKMVPSI